MHKSLQEYFTKFVSIPKDLEERIKGKIVEYIKNKEDELEALNFLTKQWQSSRTQAILLKNKLLERKGYLFDKKLLDQWNLDNNQQEKVESLLNNKEAAFKEMLPSETKDVERYKEIYRYYSNKVKEEFQRLCLKNTETYLAQLKVLIDDDTIHLDKVDV